MKLLLDEHFSQLIANKLRDKGFDAIAVSERPELVGASDSEIFGAAIEQRRALVTNNARHLLPLLERHVAAGGRHFGLVLTSDRSLPRSKRTVGTTVRALARLMASRSGEDALADEVVWLSPEA